MKLANIVCTSKISVTDEVHVVGSIDDIISGLPTLIVGYDYVNKNYPDFDITDIKLGDKLYWTFKRTEKRDKYEEDLNWFMRKVYVDLIKGISYVFVDPIQYKPKVLFKIVRKIYSLKDSVSYIDGDVGYIYGDKVIFGIDFKLLEYMNFDIEKIKNKIHAISTVLSSGNDILIEYKRNLHVLDNKVRYIPFLYSILNEQTNTNSLIHLSRKG